MTKTEREKLSNVGRWLKEAVGYLQSGRVDAGRISTEEALNTLNNALLVKTKNSKAE
ncbi:hypothetical protein CSN22_004382 [Salmonella enterica subsp. diarizonae]|nr:hypothetical protein [Salmonella enterica subsp. diarizonae]